MAQEVLYRKWRPRRFADVVGQEPVSTTLRHAVAAGTPAHAYLFTGPRGTGKTSTGRILAKAVNCERPAEGEPCGECVSCVTYDEGRSLDLIELDAASNRGIDEIRDLRESAGYAPTAGRYKVYLIDEVHMLTDAAFNALLKTLEEPPPHVIFVLATTEPYRIPATIHSRCQRFDLRLIPVSTIVGLLETIGAGEGFEVASGGYELVARQATGSARDAVNLLDQVVAYHGTHLGVDDVRAALGLVIDDRAADLARASIARDLKAGLGILAAARDDGVEVRSFIRSVVEVLRSVLLLKAGAGDQLPLSDAQREDLEALSATASVSDIAAALEALGEIDFAGDAYDSLPAEIAFATLATGLRERAAATAVAPPPAAAPVPRPAPQRTPTRPANGPLADAARTAARSTSTGAPAPAAEEAAPAQPFAPPDAGDVSDEVGPIRERWEDIVAAVRRIDRPAGALISDPSRAFPKDVTGGVLHLGFQFPAHVELSTKWLEVYGRAVAEVIGAPLRVMGVHWPELASAGTGPAPRRASTPPRASHLVEEALKHGAQPLEPGPGEAE
ncbi:MAG: DNA polymerase III subunit gamma/tau [Dehalococcoidia bacterium]